jgi:hypothetical protein
MIVSRPPIFSRYFLMSNLSLSYTSYRDKANGVKRLKIMRGLTITILIFGLVLSLGWINGFSSAETLSERLVDYDISVKLNSTDMTLTGSEWVSWTNPGQKPVSELYFHLYPNAFRSKESTFIQESGGKLRRDNMIGNTSGEMVIKEIRLFQGPDITNTLQYAQPDDQNENDRTVAFVTLPSPIEPGEKVTLSINFTVKLPKVFARMGYYDDFVMAGQWFPKLAVYEPVGRRGLSEEGWNAHQYHGNSEFYADFGTYQVSINAPENYVIAATGFPVGDPLTEQNGTKTWKYAANDVHDFGWSASPHFVYAEKSFSSPNVPGVKIKLYLDPVHGHLKDRYFKAATSSLNLLSEWYGSYPYTTLSIIVPPAGAGGAAGMEYPTLITAWDAKQEEPGESLERVVVHEIGHQYWYGMVASNEFEEAWLDEGFTSYVEDKVMNQAYKSPDYLSFEATTIIHPEPLVYPSWHFSHYNSYASNVYSRGKLVLHSIERQLGETKMKSIMNAYFQRWKFGHPNTRDFQQVLEEETGKDWTAFFNNYIYGSELVDYAVTQIKVNPIQEKDLTLYESLVSIEQKGGSYPSIPIQFGFQNGTSHMKLWNGKEEKIRFRIINDSPVKWVRIDPELTIVIESRHLNNFLRAEIDTKQYNRWNSYSINVLQMFFHWLGW